MAARNVIRMTEAERPRWTEKQRALCADLIGMGLTRLTCVGMILNKSVASLDHAEVSAGHRLITLLRQELGYGIMDARRAATPFMAAAVRDIARRHSVRIRLAS